MLELWYEKPAEFWEEALPLGNGRIGAMVWSGIALEKVSLNEDTLWSGYPNDHNVPGAGERFQEARKLAMAGKYLEAQECIETHLLGHFTQSYLPLGELLLETSGRGEVTGYRRSLNLETAAAALAYTQNGVTYTRESFVSAPDQAFVMRISADVPGAVNLDVRFTCQLRASVTAGGNRLVLEGCAPSEARPSYLDAEEPIIYEEEPAKKGMRFIAIADFEAEGGRVTATGGALRVSGANRVVIRLCARTSFNGPFRQPYTDGAPYRENCGQDLAAALRFSFASLAARHIADHQALFKRTDIDLGPGRDDLPLPRRLADWDHAERDPALFALLFQYGRYLTIAGSRPGSMPLNLQGIWNQHVRAPWSANFTVNINTEMNYWPTEAVNLSECHAPLFDFLLNTLMITGAQTAKIHYRARGFTAHHNTDIWGLSNPVGERRRGTAGYAFWPLSAGWLAAHTWMRYEYTLDGLFLRESAYPVIREAARFFLDVLTEDADGTLIFAPSTSPENSFIYEGKHCPVSKTTAMTTAIIKETLTCAVKCCGILGIDPGFKEEAGAALKRLPRYAVGSRGELLEWSEELPEAEPLHRHNSHLYPLHPGGEITPEETPELAAACRRTLELRGDESTGWSLAWRINLWARLGDGERAYRALKKQLRPVAADTGYTGGGGCYPNLFGAHPPFQIDSNYGACAGIAEMLLQSRPGRITLLPALPPAFQTGFVKGLRARGGITVSLFFKGGVFEKAELILDKHLPAQDVIVRYKGTEKAVTLTPGETFFLA
ncbi:MAG: glycoside hydrolase family 95 protein [Treponema sp.]|nr:glycoside hydrolase family 95 protein [Treponema sp.]